MTETTDTPRTDKECEKTDDDYYADGMVNADFARELERELAAAKRDAETLALRIMGEPKHSYGPECYEVMGRMKPRLEALLRGE